MGIFLYLETDPETPVCPHELTTADSKLFQNFQVLMDRPTWRAPDGTLTTLDRALRVDVSALGANSVADGTETSLEEYYEWFPDTETGRAEALQAYQRQRERDAAAWQPPQELLRCLREVIAAIDAHPDVTSQIGEGLAHADRRYFAEGWWRADLAAMLRNIEWAAEHGAKRVRLAAA